MENIQLLLLCFIVFALQFECYLPFQIKENGVYLHVESLTQQPVPRLMS